MPINVVPANTPRTTLVGDNDQSDPGPYPIPAIVTAGGVQYPLVEAPSDSHMLIVTQDECKLYEIYAATPLPGGGWSMGSAAIYDLKANNLRPDGWTSADGAGLPIMPGLVRYDEVASGVITHALRMTVPKTDRNYVWPARHFASNTSDGALPGMGTRFRLKAGADIVNCAACPGGKYDPQVQVILQALKTYGAMISDNGGAWYITGAPDYRWDNNVLAQIKNLHGSDLEAVDVSGLQGGPNSALAVDPNAPNRFDTAYSATMNFDASQAGTLSVTLAGDVTAPTVGNFIDGNIVTFIICQDGAGGHAFTWPANVAGGMMVGTAASTCSAQSFVANGTKLYATTPGMTNM